MSEWSAHKLWASGSSLEAELFYELDFCFFSFKEKKNNEMTKRLRNNLGVKHCSNVTPSGLIHNVLFLYVLCSSMCSLFHNLAAQFAHKNPIIRGYGISTPTDVLALEDNKYGRWRSKH